MAYDLPLGHDNAHGEAALVLCARIELGDQAVPQSDEFGGVFVRRQKVQAEAAGERSLAGRAFNLHCASDGDVTPQLAARKGERAICRTDQCQLRWRG